LCLYSGACLSITAVECSTIAGQVVQVCPVSSSSSVVVTISSSSVALSSSSKPSSSSVVVTISSSSVALSSSSMQSSSSVALPSSSSVALSSSATPSSSSLSATGDTFTDIRDGNVYKWVKIGTQIWMAQNLNYEASGSVCYSNSAANCATYGRLYDWSTAMLACPSGWHLPSNADWDKLLRYVDGTSGTSSPYQSSTAGRYLKAKSGWNSSGNGEDTYGFSALPGGYGYSDGGFSNVGINGLWWSSSEYGSDSAYRRYMNYYYENVFYDYDGKGYLFSVRCLQD